MTDLLDYVEENSSYISLKDGDSFTAEYLDYEIGVSPFDSNKKIVYYHFKTDKGNKKVFKTGSIAFANKMSGISKGETVTITRDGEAMKTRYSVKRKGEEPLPF